MWQRIRHIHPAQRRLGLLLPVLVVLCAGLIWVGRRRVAAGQTPTRQASPPGRTQAAAMASHTFQNTGFEAGANAPSMRTPQVRLTEPPPTFEQFIFLPLLVRDGPLSPLPPGVWDPRLDELGVLLEPADVDPGQSHWRLVEALWADEDEAGGKHHIYIEVIDAEGERIVGQAVVVEWSTGSVTLYIEDKPPPEYGANFPMYDTLGSYDVLVGDGEPTDRMAGLGLGTPEQPDFTIHTCFYLTFQWVP